jgi:hypothetical protein
MSSGAAPSKISHAASQLPAARLRLSEIFEQLESLCTELGDLYEEAGLPRPVGSDIDDQLMGAIIDCRTMLGDELYDNEWLVGDHAPMTLEELHAERWKRVKGVAS